LHQPFFVVSAAGFLGLIKIFLSLSLRISFFFEVSAGLFVLVVSLPTPVPVIFPLLFFHVVLYCVKVSFALALALSIFCCAKSFACSFNSSAHPQLLFAGQFYRWTGNATTILT
jgi:hypothetical protein